MERKRKRGRAGHAVVELSLMLPWIYSLVAGAFDVGFYSQSLTATAKAAQAAALYTSSNPSVVEDSVGACDYARTQLRGISNARTLMTCDSLPLRVTAESVVGLDGAQASRVTVVYQTPRLIPLPALPGQMTITRTAEMRVKDL